MRGLRELHTRALLQPSCRLGSYSIAPRALSYPYLQRTQRQKARDTIRNPAAPRSLVSPASTDDRKASMRLTRMGMAAAALPSSVACCCASCSSCEPLLPCASCVQGGRAQKPEGDRRGSTHSQLACMASSLLCLALRCQGCPPATGHRTTQCSTYTPEERWASLRSKHLSVVYK